MDDAMIEKRWRYKDAWREWWEVHLYKSGERQDGDDTHYEWEYRIKRDDKVTVCTGLLLGQHDNMPTLQDVMLDWTSRITSVALGFCTYEQQGEFYGKSD